MAGLRVHLETLSKCYLMVGLLGRNLRTLWTYMSAHPLHLDINAIEDLTANEVGDISLWIGQKKVYRNVPNYVSNELCRRTSPLHSVLELLPSTSLPVLQLLEFPTPRVTSTILGITSDASFSFNEATHSSFECCQLPAPPRNFLRQLRASAGQAMLDGKVSIQHWERRDIFLPFDALGTWDFILEINVTKKAWIDSLHWMEEHHHAIPEEYTARIRSLLCQVPWKDHIKGLGSGLTTMEMAAFLSKEWLSDTHIHTMLSITRHLRHDIISSASPCIEIVSPDFTSHLFNSPLLSTTRISPEYTSNAPKSVIRIGDKIRCASSGIRIAAIVYSPENHWACLIIDSKARTIQWGDSLGRPMPVGGEDRLRAWLLFFLPHIRFLPLQNLSCARQTDGYSCGIIAINTLKHNLFGDDPWTSSRREIHRIEEFLDIMEFSENWKSGVSVSSSLYTLTKHSQNKQLSMATLANVTSPLASSLPVSSLLPVIAPNSDHPNTEVLSSSFTGVRVPAKQATKAKRPRTLAFPSPKDSPCKRAKPNESVGMSKQAVWKRRIMDQIDDGVWVPDAKKWAEYNSKLAVIDRHFEVSEDPRLARQVKHSRCGAWIIMSLPYDIGRFKVHVKNCKYSKASGGMKTLDSYGVHVRPVNMLAPPPPIPSTSPSPSPTNLPCLGITEKDDPRISQYIRRTPVHSAGGDNIHDIAKELFADEFKNLSQEQKDIVRQKQLQTHSWSNDHIRKSVHAIGKIPCSGKACMAKDGSLAPCDQCLALLTLRAFRNAISRKCCENQNRGFTPHIYQSPDVGKIYSLGLYELLDGVRITNTLSGQITADFMSLDMWTWGDLNTICPSSCCGSFQRQAGLHGPCTCPCR